MLTRALLVSLLVAVPAMLFAQTPAKPSPDMTKRLTPEQVERSAIIIDTHADTPQRFVDENYDLGDPLNGGNWNLESAEKGNLGAEFFSIWVDPGPNQGHFARRTLILIDAVKQQVAKHSDKMMFVTSPEESNSLTANTRSPRSWASRAVTPSKTRSRFSASTTRSGSAT